MTTTTRAWLDRDKEITSFVATAIDKWEARLTIGDCYKVISIHSHTLTSHRSDKVRKKAVQNFVAKLMVIRDAIDHLIGECDALLND